VIVTANPAHLGPYNATALFRKKSPTHHLWHLLASQFGGPFLKTELVLRNPGRLPNIETWPAVVPPDAPCPLPVLRAHLKTMQAV
jgi:hypothetical protein